jgi:hypothetical protein
MISLSGHRVSCKFIIGLINMVAFATAMPNQTGEVYHGQPIPDGYARVGVEEVCKGYETLELDISGGDGEKTLVRPFMVISCGRSATSSSSLLIRHQGHHLRNLLQGHPA